MKKRILSLILAMVMVLGMLPVSAFATETPLITGAYLDSAGQQALTVTKAEENLSWNHYGTDISLPLFRISVPAGTEYVYLSYAEGVAVQNIADYYKDGGMTDGQMEMPEKSPMLKMPMADVLGTGKIALLYGADWYWNGAVEFVETATEPSWPFTVSVDGQALTVTDLGTTVECTKMYSTAKQLEVTVPAGTTTVVVNGVNTALYMYPDHGSQKLASPGSNTAVAVGQGSYLCMKDVTDGGWYHVAVKFAQCSHSWNDATCSAPKTCSVCGVSEGEIGDHKYVDGVCEYCGEAEPAAAPLTVTAAGQPVEVKVIANDEGQNWYFASVGSASLEIAGTAENPLTEAEDALTWTAIAVTDGVASVPLQSISTWPLAEVPMIPSSYLRPDTEAVYAVSFVLQNSLGTSAANYGFLFIELYCDHTWTAANCNAPKTCAKCGITEGEKDPKKHKFEDGACIYCGNTEGAPIPFSQKISVPANGDSTWGNISGLTLSGTDGSIYEAYWSATGNPYVLDVILGQDTDPDATITAEFSRGGSIGDRYKPTISGTLTVTLVDGKGTITMHAEAYSNAVFYPHTDWTINLTVDNGSAANRPTYEVELPTGTEGYTVTAHNSESPVIEGRQFSFKVTIDGDHKKGESFKVLVNGQEVTSSSDTYTITNITEKQVVTVEGVEPKTVADKNVVIIAPAGSTVSSGRFYSYFKYDFNEPLESTTLEDGRLQFVFPVPASQGFLRVQHPDGVTYWDFDNLNAGSTFEITEEMLFIGSSEFNKETVYSSFEKNSKDKADVYLTANEKGWLDLSTGDTWNLNVFRNFLSLGNSISNSHVALPDVEYKVISVDGGPSDVVSVTPNANNSSYAEIKAEKPGTAIILVTYDAVYNNDGEGGKQWSAIWPENTGVIIVTVDGATGGITTNMTVNEAANSTGKQVIDAEHDILFYVGSGASYSFKPEDGCTVTVNRSSVGSTMTFGGFSGSGVEVAADGTVTVSGLTTGTHIIKVEKGGSAVYQVVRARQVTYEVLDSTNAVVKAENPAEPGETLTVQFHGLVSPMEKLSGVYNANFGFWYNGEDGTEIHTSGGTYGVYNFSGSPGAQKFSFTLPATWSEETYTLTDGAIKIGGFGSSAGAHRTTTYIDGKEVNTNASGVAGVLAVLPEIEIPVNGGSGAQIDESIREDIFDSATDGTAWGRENAAYVDKLTLVGAQVQSARWDGDTCYVELVPETAADADIGFVITYAAPDMPSWANNLSGTLNGETMTPGELIAGKLEDGSFTAEVYVIYGTIAKYSGTKTFHISIGEEVQEIPVEGVILDKTSAELEIGKTLSLTATVSPDDATDKTVTWTSSDEAVATVENGVVTAVSAGEAVITAMAGDKEATCAVTVKAAQQPAEGIDILTGDTLDANFDIRVSNIHISAAGEVISNTASTDGKVTVQLAEDAQTLDITLTLFAKKGMLLKKGVVAVNNGTPTELENIDEDNSIATWTKQVTPEWTDGEMEIILTVGVKTSANWKNEKNYTLILQKAEGESGGEIPAESVTLDRASALLEIGKTLTLTATVLPENATYKTVTWTSSDETVATVEDGKVTAVGEGVAIITATTADGKKTASCTVGVSKPAEPEFGIPADEIAGYVTVSFEDFGVRVEGEDIDPAYADPKGVIIAATRVPFKANDTVASVTLRLLKAKNIEVVYTGSETGGFYLSSVDGFGEFDAGVGSGWMITLNGVFINKGASEFAVHDGDVVKWQYTCQLGADIGDTGFFGAVTEVIDLIDGIGTVTVSSGDQISAARAAYDQLSAADKNRVTNYSKLTEAEDTLTKLQKEADEKAAQKVEDLIDKLDSERETFQLDVEAAREAYDALTAEQKKLVTNYAKLTDALKQLAEDKDVEAAQEVEALIDAIGAVTKDSEAAIQAAREGYDKLTDQQKELVENIAVLEAAEEKLAKLQSAVDPQDAYKATGDYLENLGTPAPGSIGGEWMVIGLLRSGRKVNGAYYEAAVTFVQDNIDENGRLHSAKSTENSRLILALTAMGKDVTDVGGNDLLKGLSDMAYVSKQGINGPIWALIALDSGNYPAPEGDVTREGLVQAILNAQLADGGWALSGSASDPDMTGMALQALAPYRADGAVKKAVNAALTALSNMQAEDGSFAGIDGSSSESIAQVVAALSALGIDADTDARFVKNGVSALDALCAFYVEGGGFRHTPDGKLDGMATEQGYYALAAYYRMQSGKTALYDITDVVDMGGDVITVGPAQTQPTEAAPTVPADAPAKESRSFPWGLVIVIAVLGGAIAALVVIKKRR